MTTATTHKLAIDGGPMANPHGFTTRRLFGQEEKQAVIDLFDRAIEEGSHVMGYSGEQETAYGAEFAATLGGGYADGVNSGSNALYAAIAALELEPGDEVIVPPISDPGGVMPVAMLGLTPVAADSAPGSYNTDAKQIEAVLTDRTRAIVITHVSGLPVDVDPVLALARKHNLRIVEDCAQAHGAKYQGKPVGTLGDIAAFSTMFGKHHASGGQGGLVYSRSEDLIWAARRYADRGKPFNIDGETKNIAASLNCNMDELHAAIGRANLAKLPGFIQQRRKIAQAVADRCEAELQTIRMHRERPGDEGTFWFLIFSLDMGRLSVDAATFAKAAGAEGAPLSGYPFFPMRMPWARAAGFPEPALPNALEAEATNLRVSIHESWTEQDVDGLMRVLAKVEAAYLAR